MRPFTTITTRFDSKCSRCGDSVPVGTRVRYNGRVWHFAAECSQGKPAGDVTEDGSRPMGGTAVPSNRARNIPAGDPRAEFGYDGRQMGYMPTEDIENGF